MEPKGCAAASTQGSEAGREHRQAMFPVRQAGRGAKCGRVVRKPVILWQKRQVNVGLYTGRRGMGKAHAVDQFAVRRLFHNVQKQLEWSVSRSVSQKARWATRPPICATGEPSSTSIVKLLSGAAAPLVSSSSRLLGRCLLGCCLLGNRLQESRRAGRQDGGSSRSVFRWWCPGKCVSREWNHGRMLRAARAKVSP